MLITAISLAVCCLSILLNSIGLGIPYWLSYTHGQVDIHMGLWRFCITSPGQEYCGSVSSFPKLSRKDGRRLDTTRICIIISIAAIFYSGLMHLLALFSVKQQGNYPSLASALGIFSGGTELFGIGIYAAKFNNYIYSTGEETITLDLYAGFGLCIVAVVLSIITVILSFFIKHETNGPNPL